MTTARFFERKVKPVLGDLPFLKTIVLVGGGEGGVDFDALLADSPGTCEIAATRPDDLAIIHFTSGTTGRPKGAMHVTGQRSRIARRQSSRSIFVRMTSSGARPILAG